MTATAISAFSSASDAQALAGLVGTHLIYTYDNGWQYEIYIENATTVCYRIHSGMVGGRWVTDQHAYIARLADGLYTVSWDEPTGTVVSLNIDLGPQRRLHGLIVFPQWVAKEPGKTVCYQNQHLPLMQQYRDAGPTYPKVILDEFARITFAENCGADRDDVIACGPADLPAGYAERTN
ncbi:phenolic acid decarboxylase [uncultured Ralstonia sp.]|jgi:phenolic acid decarboxylase|uniref:phenolic acid decarboxylase n=1 Tax=Ralstonia sp. TaxID=54061 RepID=UPI001EA8746F|nr:phenolic acid decarboxylase [uncultured Ralstonia sp.]UCF25381.1 MAG: phenolic acid decarboxylase [Ralstonia sp.]